MKIINCSAAQRRHIEPEDQQKLLTQERVELHHQLIPLSQKRVELQHQLISLSQDLKYGSAEYRAMLELLAPLDDEQKYIHVLQEAIMFQTMKNLALSATQTFTLFPDLPLELRLKIWDYTLEPHLQQRVHHICLPNPSSAIRPIRLQSNQPIHPILHVCYESRSRYHSRNPLAKFSPGLKTYINFSTDIIYIPDVPYLEPYGLLSYFLFGSKGCGKEIQRLAMPKSLYCNHLSFQENQGHMSIVHARMRGRMPEWKEMMIVFEDVVVGKDDLEWKVVDLSAKEKRKRAERGYARTHAKALNRMIGMLDPPVEPMEYKFVFLKPQ